MCITAVALNAHPEYPFVLLFNRDEAFERLTAVMAEWSEPWEGIIAGRDLMGGGTWLGISRDGKFVALTNFSDEDEELLKQMQARPSNSVDAHEDIGYLTRGHLPLRILRKDADVLAELNAIWGERSRYKSFNLFSGDIKQNRLYYLSVNQADHAFKGIKSLGEGIFCMSNTDIHNA